MCAWLCSYERMVSELHTVVDLPGKEGLKSTLTRIAIAHAFAHAHHLSFLAGVELYQRVGTLDTGLPQYASLRGSSRDENLHYCLNALAARRLGPELATCLLMHMISRFNFRGGVLYKGWPDCGHDDTW